MSVNQDSAPLLNSRYTHKLAILHGDLDISSNIASINVKTKFIKNGYRRRSCTSKTAKNSPFHQTCNVLFRHYSASSILLSYR